jgi:hypothetical protein
MRYFLATYIRKPNGQIDEQVQLANRLKDNDLQTCNVILDFQEKKIIKCLINSSPITSDWNAITAYYAKVYPDIIAQLQTDNP